MPPAGRPLRVLVVDDNRDLVLSMMELLLAEGHESQACYDGTGVWDCVEAFDPDVILLDIGLPGMSGWDVAQVVRSRIRGKRPMIIGITGEYTKGGDRALAQIHGFDYYLLKPADPNYVLALVEKARHLR